MTIETRHRPPSFGTLYGLPYNPDAAFGSVLVIGEYRPLSILGPY
jgi:hypothetical protein